MARIVKKLELKNKLGLHARAAALLVQTVNQFSSEVRVSKDGIVADARSIMALLTLGAAKESKIQVEIKGKDAEEALRAIERLVEKKFHETE
jgi:phosphotransferase system HPr (HPr) family protein